MPSGEGCQKDSEENLSRLELAVRCHSAAIIWSRYTSARSLPGRSAYPDHTFPSDAGWRCQRAERLSGLHQQCRKWSDGHVSAPAYLLCKADRYNIGYAGWRHDPGVQGWCSGSCGHGCCERSFCCSEGKIGQDPGDPEGIKEGTVTRTVPSIFAGKYSTTIFMNFSFSVTVSLQRRRKRIYCQKWDRWFYPTPFPLHPTFQWNWVQIIDNLRYFESWVKTPATRITTGKTVKIAAERYSL